MEKVTQIHNVTSEQLTQQFAEILDQRIEDLKHNFTPKEPDEFFTGKELEKLLKISSVTRWEWGKKQILQPRKIANKTYYLRSEIKELLMKSNN